MLLTPPVNRALRLITLTLVAVAALCLLYVWADLLHRWSLFRSYGSEPYMNHVDASYFVSIPRYATVGEKLAYRRLLIRRWREFLAQDFDQHGFQGTAVYSEMRPHLSQATLRSIEADEITLRMGRGGNVIQSLVLDDIARLEQKWDLV